MIEQALYGHLKAQQDLADFLATYDNQPAVFSQEAPADTDELWNDGPQYGRIVFAVDLQGDPARIMSGTLAVDIMCKKDEEQYPEDIEPIIRSLIHGYFFSQDTFTVSAQWRDSTYFTQPEDQVTGCTVAFNLLAFPVVTTSNPDVVARFNAWSSTKDNLHVINYDKLPAQAWKPSGKESAVYWRVANDAPANWIKDTFSTIWRTATVKGHIFSETPAEASTVVRDLAIQLHADKRLLKAGEAPIMVNRRNTTDDGADPLRTGQLTVEATYGVIVHFDRSGTIQHINHLKGDQPMATSDKAKAAPVNARVNESVYSAAELADNHQVFKTSREIVEVALRVAGKTSATFTEAKAIIEKFKNKEVK